MNFNDFQKLIGKNILEAHQVIDGSFNSDTSNNDLCFIATKTESYKYFYGMPCYYILISNNENIIDSITFYFYGIIDKSFYNAFTDDFESPNTIQIVDSVKVISEEEQIQDIFTQNLKKSFIETREGEFEENPLFMIWNKENYEIKIFLKYQSNTSIITFKKTINN